MSAHKDEKWLDEQLQQAVNGVTPTFDAQAWKQKYADEYEALAARGRQNVGWGLPHHNRPDTKNRWGKPHPTVHILRGSFARLAVAATLIIAAGVLLTGRFRVAQPTPAPQPVPQPSPAQMVSMISLSVAFQRGGIEELDKQCDRALEKLGPRPNSVSRRELLKDISKG